MYSEGIDILDEADCDHLSLSIADNLELELFPAEDRLLNKHLSNEAGLDTTLADNLKFFCIINESAAGTAHRVSGTQNNGVSESVGDLKRLLYGVSNLRPCHLDTELFHGLFELDTVLTALDRIKLYADDLNSVLIKDPLRTELRA